MDVIRDDRVTLPDEARDQAPDAATAVPRPLAWRSALTSSVLVALGRPELWPVALVSFLIRGGLFVFLLPIVVLPTAVGVANFVGPLAITPAGPSAGFVQFLAALAALTVGWFILACVGGAVVDAFLIRAVSGDELVPGEPAALARSVSRVREVSRLAATRAISLLPALVTLWLVLPGVIQDAYIQLTNPSNLLVPVPLRVVQDQPVAFLALLGAWLIGETISALAARRVVLSGSSTLSSLAGGVADLIHRPITTTSTAIIGLMASVAAIAPSVVAAALAWNRLRVFLLGDGDAAGIVIIAPVFVAIWAGGLVLAGLVGAWRSVLWTFDVMRLTASEPVAEAAIPDEEQLTSVPAP